jgi:pyrroline-5-carboxylate reductase
MSATVFLGGGRITSALVAGLRGAGHRGRIVVFDRHSHKLRQLRRKFDVETTDDLRCAAEQALPGGRSGLPGILLLAIRPVDVLPLLAELGRVPPRTLVVSLAAGVPLRVLSGTLGPGVEWARAMPSPAARAGLGLTALAFGRAMRPAGRRQVCRFFQRVGAVLEIPEGQFDAFTVVYSTSQGCEALLARMRAARKIGLGAKIAFVAAAHSLADGIRALRGNPVALSESLKEAATPGGIAARVLETMHRAGNEKVVERAFRAGLAQARAFKRRMPRR